MILATIYLSVFALYLYLMEHDLTGYSQVTERFFYNRFLRLGGGSFGNVFKGYDNEKKRFIAVKHIPRVNLFGLPPGELKEIAIMRKLKHPNIMEFYGSSGNQNAPDGIFMFLELCEGGTLSNLIAAKLTELRASELFKQLVEGMSYMHEQRLFHRDLKPDNLLITSIGDLKIADFGIAREIQEGNVTFKRCTPIYSAPQVYIQEIYERNEEAYNQKCDVFSAGYILYEMLTSEQLNKGVKTALDLHKFLMNNKKRGGFQFDHPALTPRWVELLKRMLSFDPEQRPSFAAIRTQLKQFLPAIDKLPQVRPTSINQQKQSAELVRKVRALVELLSARNNYLIGLLRIIHRFQQQRSQLMPRVYKVILLYLSLSRFCFLSEDGLKFIDDKDSFILPDLNRSLSDIEEYLTLDDKVALTSFLKATSSKINKGKEQMKLFLLGEVLTLLNNLLRQAKDNPQRRVVQEYELESSLTKIKVNQYENDYFYVSKIERCVNNLYRTAAELEVLTDQDLRIYLVSLYIANIDKYVDIKNYEKCKLPPSYEDILAMDRKQLEQRIAAEKNKP